TSVVRTYGHIAAMVEEARLPARVRLRALAVFEALAGVEGRLHRRPPEQVHFHEVGALDAIVDVVGTAAALEVLGVDDVRCSPVATGTGMVRAAHGLLPNPAPATVELLIGCPTYGLDVGIELTTPTGAALVSTLVSSPDGFGPLPPMVIDSVGFGAGTNDSDGRPNVVQVVLGTATTAAPGGHPLIVLATNVDDATGEVLAHTVTALLDAGALDAWIVPILMKKGRPASTVHALVDPALVDVAVDVLRRETGALGVRGTAVQRWPASREDTSVAVDGLPVRVKVSPGRLKVEHDDAAKVARLTGRPLREVLSLAEEAARSDQGSDRLEAVDPEPDGEPA
ncbi:MAG: nickel pincer cofactor biosynthesis protein LarC, partial [Acidimicrobiales bacterium]